MPEYFSGPNPLIFTQMQNSYVFLADGFEEVEALTPVDVLRRAGMAVQTVSIMPGRTAVTGAHGVKVEADLELDAIDIKFAEWLILPGGMPGAENLANCRKLTDLIEHQHKQGGKIAAICASPGVVLGPLGVLDGIDATGYPGFEKGAPHAHWQGSSVVATPQVVTGKGPAAALRFSLALVAQSLGVAFADDIADAMQVEK